MISIIHENILEVSATTIVNPAHTSLLAGSGLCGIIHKYAGRELEKHCELFGEQTYGNVVVTPAFNLSQFQTIIHACCPQWWDGNQDEANLLKKTYQNIIDAVVQQNISSIAIPALATGIYRFPIELAAEIALSAMSEVEFDVFFVNMEQEKHECYGETYSRITSRI